MDRPQNDPAVSPRHNYWITRFVLIRLLSAVYVVAFLGAARQLVPLIGAHGLLPLAPFLDQVARYFGSRGAGFWHLPSLFWFWHSDAALLAVSWIGVALALVALAGCANAPLMAVLWMLYMSIVHVGQTWYAYGWESQLLETGFLAIFLCPLWDLHPFSRHEPPLTTIWLFRWLIFRIMLGAGLIKLRGDASWKDLTALYYQFETQPLPNPLSRWFHFLPKGVLRGGVMFNHVAELLAPLLVFWPRVARIIAGTIIVVFQLVLIVSGNLSFLNWLTIIPALACFDDAVWLSLMPFLRRTWDGINLAPLRHPLMRRAAIGVTVLVIALSVQPMLNLLSSQQIMNTTFEPFDLVNTYGAFGSVGETRQTIVFEGTDAADPNRPGAQWREYLYVAQPVLVDQRPRQIAPYQPRLDWAVWFAAMAGVREYPWTLHVVWKLLHNDPGMLSLFGSNPFPDHPPRYVRVMLYTYKFVRASERPRRWWDRTPQGIWLPPLSVESTQLTDYLAGVGWKD